MRFNDRELVTVGESKPDLEGILHHMKPQANDWSDWYQQPSFKERHFKLIANLLYYYRVNASEQEQQQPLGVLVLENAQVAYERPHKGIPFAFSITFKVNDKFKDNEAKHIFSCRCDADVNKWVSALKMHSYEYWRCQYIILKTKISMKTGQDPILDYMRSKNPSGSQAKKVEVKKVRNKEKKSTFCSHLESSTFFESSYTETKVVTKTSNIAVDNLIDL
ncbi:pleckstrin homology domain-containing family J member 1 [Tribolium castaneum]|uniref:Pleckstrin homology domain-containing family J member 1 n=1 Tax=Tribolium castaneum TaxID=7070 RepID=D6W8E4_TRICA|nr:PREDICTED: pleckstrin homology domain-containing family J member 1 [Tribolium castaneum]EFA10941.1 Pleckstrin homology domain-containing family J member 1-like Protein [Tribolium castaneum]|eukprot:XP_001810604.1 PREDICTED: pleckstrin homology domain-containing family J member 1 [Tribolium castaneum]